MNRPPIHRPQGHGSGQRIYDASPSRKADKLFFGSAVWRAVRLEVLARDNYVCATCKEPSESPHVDHRISRRERPDLALDMGNLVTLCLRCHSRKTARHDGGFGNAAKRAI